MTGYNEHLDRADALLADLHTRLDQEDLVKNDRQVDTEIWTAGTKRESACRWGIDDFVKFGKQFGVTVVQAAAYFAVSEEFVEKQLIKSSDQNPDNGSRPPLQLRGDRFVHRDFIAG